MARLADILAALLNLRAGVVSVLTFVAGFTVAGWWTAYRSRRKR